MERLSDQRKEEYDDRLLTPYLMMYQNVIQVEALSTVQNCLLIIKQGGDFPFFPWVIEDRGLASLRLGDGSQAPYQARGSPGAMPASKRTVIITLKQVEQELAYALAARQYLLRLLANSEESSAGGRQKKRLGGEEPLRPLGLAYALYEPGKGDHVIVNAVRNKVCMLSYIRSGGHDY